MSKKKKVRVMCIAIIGMLALGAIAPLVSVLYQSKQEKEMMELYESMLQDALEEADKEVDNNEENSNEEGHEHSEECDHTEEENKDVVEEENKETESDK